MVPIWNHNATQIKSILATIIVQLERNTNPSIHSANRYMFRWFIYIGSGEYEVVRTPAPILRELG